MTTKKNVGKKVVKIRNLSRRHLRSCGADRTSFHFGAVMEFTLWMEKEMKRLGLQIVQT